MSKGVDRLAQAIDARIRKRTAAPSMTDFGTITGDGSLQLDQFGPPIPRSGYLVEHRMTHSLYSGDRVIVLWVRDDPVVIGKVVDANA